MARGSLYIINEIDVIVKGFIDGSNILEDSTDLVWEKKISDGLKIFKFRPRRLLVDYATRPYISKSTAFRVMQTASISRHHKAEYDFNKTKSA